MVQFLLKRLIGLLFVVIGVTFITFIIGYFAPGDPITYLLGQRFNPATYNALRHAYGLDLPWWQQYANYLHNLFTFNFGLSFTARGRSVESILANGVPISLELGFWGLLLTIIVGVPLGIVSALKANTWVDTANMSAMLFLFAIPVFVVAVVVQVFIVWLNKIGIYWPVSNWGTPWSYDWNDLQFKLAPILVLAAGGAASLARFMRSSMLEVLRQDYVRTARAKGLREQIVIYRHALRNALIPLITVISLALGTLVGGAFYIEMIFNIPGIAGITLASATSRDYPVIQATTVLLTTTIVLGNVLADVLYAVVDPRIKIE